MAEDNGSRPRSCSRSKGSRGQVRIVDAPVEMRGTASDGLIACVQQVLRGHVIPAAAARPGTRYRIPVPAAPSREKEKGGASAAPPLSPHCSLRRGYGTTRLVRIISESSCELMWQCHTYGPEVTGS